MQITKNGYRIAEFTSLDPGRKIVIYTDSHRRLSRPEKIQGEGFEKLPVYSIDLQGNKQKVFFRIIRTCIASFAVNKKWLTLMLIKVLARLRCINNLNWIHIFSYRFDNMIKGISQFFEVATSH